MKKLLTFILLTILIVTLTACSGTANAYVNPTSLVPTTVSDVFEPIEEDSNISSSPIIAEYDTDDLSVDVNDADITTINLQGESIAVEGGGVTVNGTIVTITTTGVYSIQGALDDGQIVVDTQDDQTVTLILNGADITNNTSAPIYVANAEKVVVTLADGTQNTVTDGTTYYYSDESDEPNAAIFSRDDLTINGNGALTVNANFKDGIASKDDLKIVDGIITVNAVNDGIKGKDSVSIRDGVITINAGADGIQSTNADETEKGTILIEGGAINITSVLDGIQAETTLQINGGSFSITSGGGGVNNSTTGGGIWGGRGMEGNPNKPTESAKGLKAGVDITITAGMFDINSADDSIHANNSITINGGDFLLTSGDDGMHADSNLEINDGEINIAQSYEGIESAIITINGGNIHLTASDDGINAAGGVDGSSINGRPGQNEFVSSDYMLQLNGGNIFVDAYGDGIDVNGTLDMTAGTVIVNGPTNNGNGPLDYLGMFNISDGFLVAVGSSGMAQAPSTTSTQYSVMYNFQSMRTAGTLIHIESGSGEYVLTFEPTKEYQSVLLSSSQIQDGETYVVYTAGSSTGTVVDGLYSDGNYTGGTEMDSFSITSVITAAGATGAGFPGGPGRDRPSPP